MLLDCVPEYLIFVQCRSVLLSCKEQEFKCFPKAHSCCRSTWTQQPYSGSQHCQKNTAQTDTPVCSCNLQPNTTRCPLLPTLLFHIQLMYCSHTLSLQWYSLHWKAHYYQVIFVRRNVIAVCPEHLFRRIGGFLLSFPSSPSPSYPQSLSPFWGHGK